MGSYLMKLWWGGDPDVSDPFSGLSKRDIYAIQQSWAPLYARAGDFGVALFLRFFQADPETKTYFKSIRNMSDEEITRNPQFRAHAINLMSSLNMAVQNLDTPEVVVAMMYRLGNTHNKHKIQEHHFETFKRVLVDFLQNDCKSSPAVMGSWSRFITFIYTHIFENLHGNS